MKHKGGITKKKKTTKGNDPGSWHEEGRDEAHVDPTSSTNYRKKEGRGKNDTKKEETEEALRNKKAFWG